MMNCDKSVLGWNNGGASLNGSEMMYCFKKGERKMVFCTVSLLGFNLFSKENTCVYSFDLPLLAYYVLQILIIKWFLTQQGKGMKDISEVLCHFILHNRHK